MENGELVDVVLNKKSPTLVPICLILNDRYLFSAQVPFDKFSRVVLQGSFSEVSAPNACESNSLWFPLGCPKQLGTYGEFLLLLLFQN